VQGQRVIEALVLIVRQKEKERPGKYAWIVQPRPPLLDIGRMPVPRERFLKGAAAFFVRE
jgi:hypothetical protein